MYIVVYSCMPNVALIEGMRSVQEPQNVTSLLKSQFFSIFLPPCATVDTDQADMWHGIAQCGFTVICQFSTSGL